MTMPNQLPQDHEFATPAELAVLFDETQHFVASYCPPDQFDEPECGPYRALEISMKAIRAWAPQQVAALSARRSMNLALWPERLTDSPREPQVCWTWYHRELSPHLTTTMTIGPNPDEPDGWYQDRDHDLNHWYETAYPESSGKGLTAPDVISGMRLGYELGIERLVHYEATALTGIVRALAARPPEEIYAALYVDQDH